MDIHDQPLAPANVYGYNTDELSFNYELLQNASCYNSTIITCGDWNMVQDINIYTYNVKHSLNPNSRKRIDEIIETLDFIDPWRANHTDKRKYTWRQHSPIKQSRLDYFLVTGDIFALTKILKAYQIIKLIIQPLH